MFGFSSEQEKLVQRYVAESILPSNPFTQLDEVGLGHLLQVSMDKAVSIHPHIKLGVCVHQPIDTHSVQFVQKLGCHFISCALSHVCAVKLTAAQASIRPGFTGKILLVSSDLLHFTQRLVCAGRRRFRHHIQKFISKLETAGEVFTFDFP